MGSVWYIDGTAVKKGVEFGSLGNPVPKDMPFAISAEWHLTNGGEEKAAALPRRHEARRVVSDLDQSKTDDGFGAVPQAVRHPLAMHEANSGNQ